MNERVNSYLARDMNLMLFLLRFPHRLWRQHLTLLLFLFCLWSFCCERQNNNHADMQTLSAAALLFTLLQMVRLYDGRRRYSQGWVTSKNIMASFLGLFNNLRQSTACLHADSDSLITVSETCARKLCRNRYTSFAYFAGTNVLSCTENELAIISICFLNSSCIVPVINLLKEGQNGLYFGFIYYISFVISLYYPQPLSTTDLLSVYYGFSNKFKDWLFHCAFVYNIIWVTANKATLNNNDDCFYKHKELKRLRCLLNSIFMQNCFAEFITNFYTLDGETSNRTVVDFISMTILNNLLTIYLIHLLIFIDYACI
jgi:hypothetical protein